MILKFIYTLFIGILLALFVGFGIAAFYEEPRYPEPPVSLRYPALSIQETKPATSSSLTIQEQIKQEGLEKKYQKSIEDYNRIVSTIGIISAIIYLILSLLFVKNLQILSDSLLLGGVFTLLYSIGRGFGSHDSKFQFITVAIGLVISLYLGYIKFVKSVSK